MTEGAFVFLRKSRTTTTMAISKAAFQWINSEFVKVYKTAEKIYVVACDVSEYGAQRAFLGSSGRHISIGSFVAGGSIPERMMDQKRHAVKKCTFNGKHAIYLNIE